MTDTDVLGYLHAKGLHTKHASHNNVNLACFFCNEPDGKRGRLYVNVDPNADILGLYHCKLCDARGSLVSIRKFFGDVTEKEEREDTSYQRRAIFEFAADHYHEALDRHLPALRYLMNERGLTNDTIEKFRLGYAGEHDGLFRKLRKAGFAPDEIAATGLAKWDEVGRPIDFLNDHITIPYSIAGNVVMIRGRAMGDVDPGKKYLTGPGQKSRLFNTDASWGAEEIIVCEGEFDCMVLDQLGFSAVSVPGANTWQDAWDGYFADCRRAWVVFDREVNKTGEKAATKVLDHLGAKGRLVELPEHEKGKSKNDITEWIVGCGHTKDDFEALLKASHGSLVTVTEAIAEHTDLMSSTGLRLGLSTLDSFLHPGLLPSQVMVINANTSSGKTVFLLNLFHYICTAQPDAKILFLSLEQTRSEWWERARRIYRFFNPGASDADAEKFWNGRIWLDDRNRVSPDQLLAVLEDFRYEVGQKPDLVAIDYLGYWAQSFKGERYERTSDAIMMMKALAKEERLRFIAPHQVSRGTTHGTEPGIQSGRDSGVVEETADFLFTIWRPDTSTGRDIAEHTGEFKLAIGKSRHGGAGHVEHFYFAPLSLAIVPATKQKLVTQARNELRLRLLGESWEQAQVRHEVGAGPDEPYQKVLSKRDQSRQSKLKVVA